MLTLNWTQKVYAWPILTGFCRGPNGAHGESIRLTWIDCTYARALPRYLGRLDEIRNWECRTVVGRTRGNVHEPKLSKSLRIRSTSAVNEIPSHRSIRALRSYVLHACHVWKSRVKISFLSNILKNSLASSRKFDEYDLDISADFARFRNVTLWYLSREISFAPKIYPRWFISDYWGK